MFTLKLYDRKGTELNEGDVVHISDGKSFDFWAEVKYLEKENAIAPFHTFSFHSFVKVDKVPEHAVKSTEERYNIWYVYKENAETDNEAELFENYLMSWRECESMIDKRCFRIQKLKEHQLTLFK